MAQTQTPSIDTFTGHLASEVRVMMADTERAAAKTTEAAIKELDATHKAERAILTARLATQREGLRALEGNGQPSSRAGNGHTATTRGPGRTRSRPSRAKRSTPRAISLPSADDVLAQLRQGKTQTAAIAKALRSNPEPVLRRLKTLEAAGTVKRQGERRQSKWIVMAPSATMKSWAGSGAQGAAATAA